MTKAVLLGGNGYIGRATTKAWMKADPETEFYVISRVVVLVGLRQKQTNWQTHSQFKSRC